MSPVDDCASAGTVTATSTVGDHDRRPPESSFDDVTPSPDINDLDAAASAELPFLLDADDVTLDALL